MPAPAIRIAGTALVHGEAGWPYAVASRATRRARTPEPLRRARKAAREARAAR